MISSTLVLVLVLHLFSFASAEASIIHVSQDGKGDAVTIQGGVDLAAPGDTVSLSPGEYTESVTITGKWLTLRGELGAGSTSWFGDWQRRFLTIRSVPQGVTVEGITITHGRAGGTHLPDDSGGAIFCLGASLTVRECEFRSNLAENRGGAIYINIFDLPIPFAASGAPAQAAPGLRLESCRFTGNITGGFGGAVFFEDTPTQIVDSMFDANIAAEGGAVLGRAGTACLVERSEFSDNSAGNAGALSVGGDGPFVVRHTQFRGNQAESRGGAIQGLNVGLLSLEDCSLVENMATFDGGGLHITGTAMEADRVLWSTCSAGGDGGGAWVQSLDTALFSHCTWIDNTAETGTALNLRGTAALINNSIVADDGAEPIRCLLGGDAQGTCNGRGPETAEGCLDYAGTVTVNLCPAEAYALCAPVTLPGCPPLGHTEAVCAQPCNDTAVHTITWGSMKTRFR